MTLHKAAYSTCRGWCARVLTASVVFCAITGSELWLEARGADDSATIVTQFKAYCFRPDAAPSLCTDAGKPTPEPLPNLPVALKYFVIRPAYADDSTVADLFKQYCGEDDHNPTVCDPKLELTNAAQLLIIRDYCMVQRQTQPAFCRGLTSVETPKILAFDHARQRWLPKGATNPETGSTLWFENETVRGTPTVKVGSKDPLAVAVVETNPILFSAELGSPEAATVETLASAQALLTAAGSALSAGLAGLVTSAAAPPSPPGAAAPAPKAIKPTPPAETNPALIALDALVKALDDPEKQVAALAKAAGTARDQWNEIVTTMQAREAERGKSALQFPSNVTPATPSGSSVDIDIFYSPTIAEWADALRKLQDLHQRLEPCKADFPADVLPDFPKVVTAIKFTAVCPFALWQRDTWKDSASWSEDVKKKIVANATAVLPKIADMQNHLARLLDEKEPLLGVLARLRESVGRAFRYGVVKKDLSHGFVAFGNELKKAEDLRTLTIGRHLMVAEEPMAGRWDHTQTYPLKITRVKDPTDSVVTLLASDLAPKYRVVPKVWSTLGFSIGIVARTTAELRTWEKAGPENGRYVRRVSSSGRAGKLAATVNYRFIESLWPEANTWKVRPGIEFGAALDATTPALLLGVTMEIGRVLRVGWGTSWWVLPELDGQTENQPIAENDTVRTRSAFRSWLPYVSVSVALDSLGLFSK